MAFNSKIGAGVVAAAGAALGASAVLACAALAEGVLSPGAAHLSRRAFPPQVATLPPFPSEEPAVQRRMDANALAINEAGRCVIADAPKEYLELSVDNGSLRLVGKIIYAERASRNWVVLAHPYRSSSRAMEPYAALYLRHGFNVLNLDLRAHGQSEGNSIGLGWKDGQDILEWVGYLSSRFGNDISVVLHGCSMGAAAVLNATGWCSYPQIVAAVSDSSFATFKDITQRVLRKTLVPPAEPTYQLLRLGCFLRERFDFNKDNPIQAVAASTVPTLFLHGAKDSLVPASLSAELYSVCAAPSKRLHVIPDATHACGYYTDPQDYEHVVFEFLNRIGLAC